MNLSLNNLFGDFYRLVLVNVFHTSKISPTAKIFQQSFRTYQIDRLALILRIRILYTRVFPEQLWRVRSRLHSIQFSLSHQNQNRKVVQSEKRLKNHRKRAQVLACNRSAPDLWHKRTEGSEMFSESPPEGGVRKKRRAAVSTQNSTRKFRTWQFAPRIVSGSSVQEC